MFHDGIATTCVSQHLDKSERHAVLSYSYKQRNVNNDVST